LTSTPTPRSRAISRWSSTAKKYIRAGDIFQAVPSQRFTAPFERSPFAFYRALRRLNPSPFMFYVNFGGFQISGSSPEILVRVRDGELSRPPDRGNPAARRHAGSGPRPTRSKLIADPKERAEHLMLLDLGRNDVGRVAARGTVKVTESFTIERYSHVMHIVSNVQGVLKPGEDMVSAFAAGFPAGTTSGAPKIRAMEIITELEPTRAASMPAASAISARAATWIPASRCAPRFSRTARYMCRPAAASSTTPTQRASSRRRSTRPARSSARPKKPRAMIRGNR
jgi:anthranilate synthase component 1